MSGGAILRWFQPGVQRRGVTRPKSTSRLAPNRKTKSVFGGSVPSHPSRSDEEDRPNVAAREAVGYPKVDQAKLEELARAKEELLAEKLRHEIGRGAWGGS